MRTALASAVAAALLSAAVSGQQTPATRETRDTPIAHKTFVLTGCLIKSGNAPATTFELTDATAIGEAPPTPTEARPVPTSGQKLAYRLKPATSIGEAGVREDELTMHAGQRVQVTVHDGTSVAPPSTPAAQTSQAPARAQAVPQAYTVSAIELVSGMCL